MFASLNTNGSTLLLFTPVHCVRPAQSVKSDQSNTEIFNCETEFFIFILQGLCTISFLFITWGRVPFSWFILLGGGVFNLRINWNLCRKLLELIPAESSAKEDKEEGLFDISVIN